jgi:transposase-like protein
MSKQEFSVLKLADKMKTEADAYLLLEELRWGGAPTACPKCGGMDRCSYIEPRNGVSRKTRTGTASQRRVWFCGHCRKQFAVLTNTIFHGTKIPIRTWLLVIFDFCSAKNSISAWEISRRYNITNESAWHMLHRIREAMKREPLAALFSGQIQADETWIGGEPKNRHARDKREPNRRYAQTDQTPVFALVNYETREIRSRVVPNVNGKTLLSAIQENVDTERTMLHTDGAKAYLTAAPYMRGHESVSHERGEYVRDGVSTNILEGFFAQLKRSLDGTHHHVSVEHLDRYLAQFDFMYSTCKRTDSERMRRVIENVDGRRLTYKPLATG